MTAEYVKHGDCIILMSSFLEMIIMIVRVGSQISSFWKSEEQI